MKKSHVSPKNAFANLVQRAERVDLVIFIDHDNCQNALLSLQDALSLVAEGIYVLLFHGPEVPNKIKLKDVEEESKGVIKVIQSKTRTKNAADTVLSCYAFHFNMELSNDKEFLIVSGDKAYEELQEQVKFFGREKVTFINGQSVDLGNYLYQRKNGGKEDEDAHQQSKLKVLGRLHRDRKDRPGAKDKLYNFIKFSLSAEERTKTTPRSIQEELTTQGLIGFQGEFIVYNDELIQKQLSPSKAFRMPRPYPSRPISPVPSLVSTYGGGSHYSESSSSAPSLRTASSDDNYSVDTSLYPPEYSSSSSSPLSTVFGGNTRRETHAAVQYRPRQEIPVVEMDEPEIDQSVQAVLDYLANLPKTPEMQPPKRLDRLVNFIKNVLGNQLSGIDANRFAQEVITDLRRRGKITIIGNVVSYPDLSSSSPLSSSDSPSAAQSQEDLRQRLEGLRYLPSLSEEPLPHHKIPPSPFAVDQKHHSLGKKVETPLPRPPPEPPPPSWIGPSSSSAAKHLSSPSLLLRMEKTTSRSPVPPPPPPPPPLWGGEYASPRQMEKEKPMTSERPQYAAALMSPDDLAKSKQQLHEYLQRKGDAPPLYTVTKDEGPSHDRRFEVDCIVNNTVVGKGHGTSKALAERVASLNALQFLKLKEQGVKKETRSAYP